MPLRYRNFILALILVAIDQLTKLAAARRGNVFANHAFAFSLPLPAPLIYVVYLIIVIVIIWYVRKHYHRFTSVENFAWVLVVAGAASNIAERVFVGYVKDFIYLFSGVFNIADLYILLGIGLLFIVRGKIKRVT